MTTRMGRKLAELGDRVVGGTTRGRCGWRPSAKGARRARSRSTLGVLFGTLGSAETDAFAVHQYGVAFMILSAALRLMRVDHIDTQAILFEVDATAAGAYAGVLDASPRRHVRVRADDRHPRGRARSRPRAPVHELRDPT